MFEVFKDKFNIKLIVDFIKTISNLNNIQTR